MTVVVPQDKILQEKHIAEDTEQHKAEEHNNVNGREFHDENHKQESIVQDGSDQIDVEQPVQDEQSPVQRTTSTSGVPYSAFGKWDKKFIVLTATGAAFFSPLSAQIYFPALTTIASDLHVSNSKINLTMTTYMILQAIAPAFIGGFSDTAGRRPAYIVCFIIYIGADIALALQRNYVALLILRMVQSGGSSGTVALANAVVADIATSAERGIYVSITSLAGILAPSLGPILGGVLSQYAGWHWIFWFLAIFAISFFIPLLIFFPETCRKIVDDGTIPPPSWNRSLMNYVNEKKRAKEGIFPDYAARDALAKKRRIRFPNPLGTLEIVFEKEAFIVLFFSGMVYAGFYAVITGMSSQLKGIYGFDDTKVGLMFLPLSGGSIAAALTQGKMIDWNYRQHATKLGIKVNKGRQQNLTNFPIEKARLQISIPMVYFTAASTIGYGWILEARTSIAGPIVMLFLLGYGLIASSQTISILIVDINPGRAGTATAGYNLVRCLLGAGATALVVPMVDAIGVGWTYTFVGLLMVVLSPMLFAAIHWGPKWRKIRAEEDQKNAQHRVEKV